MNSDRYHIKENAEFLKDLGSDTNDPFAGMHFDENAMIHVPERPGLGVFLRD